MRPNYPSTPPGRVWRVVQFPLVAIVIGIAILAPPVRHTS